MHGFFKKNYAKLFGFFVTAEGFVKNQIRNTYYDSDDSKFEFIKLREGAEYEKHLSDILENSKLLKGNLGLIKDVFRYSVSCVGNFHASKLKQSYEIVFDATNSLDPSSTVWRVTKSKDPLLMRVCGRVEGSESKM